MKEYRARPGVVLLEVCGEYLLIATGEARGHCPDITQLNTAGALYWQAITEEESLALAVERVKQEAPEPKQDPRLLLMVYLRKLLDNGFLLEEDA